MSETTLEKEEGQNAEAKDNGGLHTEGKTFTQEELNSIIAKEEKKWKTKHSETFTNAKGYEELQKKLKEQQDAELSELEKTRKELVETLPFKERATKLESALAKYLEAEIERIPEEMRGLVPTKLSIEEQLEYIAENRERLSVQPKNPQGPSVKNLQTTHPDKLREQAEEKVRTYYPREVIGSDSWKVKVERIYNQLKNLAQT